MIHIERHENIPLSEVGAFVQRCLDSGAAAVIVTRQPDAEHCVVSVQRD
jgi:hypothetical protein